MDASIVGINADLRGMAGYQTTKQEIRSSYTIPDYQ